MKSQNCADGKIMDDAAVLRLAVFQYLPFFSNALPLAPIGALGTVSYTHLTLPTILRV